MRSLPAAILTAAVWLSASAASAQAPSEREERAPQERGEPQPIQDNSFLMEEAYNQEPGIVQHINAFVRDRRTGEWSYALTQEWPVPEQTHQLSYTIPVQRVMGDAVSHTGLGDIGLNYRYQLVGNSETRFAVAPRLTVLLPTGDHRRELGAGSLGVQTNTAASFVLSRRFVAHWNAGGTYVPRARNAAGEKADAGAVNVGQSVIAHLRPTLDLMLEAVWTRTWSVAGPRRRERSDSALVSPGIRYAWNFRNGLQVVPGIAFPLGIGPSRGERSVFLYLSFEHAFVSTVKGPGAQ